MKWITIAKGVLALIFLHYISACSTVTTAKAGSGDENEARVEYMERSFSTKLAVLDLKDRKLGNLLQVNATLRNKWHITLRFQYQFRFFDQDGFPVSPESRPWIPLTIAGNDEVDVTAVAPNPSAEHYKIVIQRDLIEAY